MLTFDNMMRNVMCCMPLTKRVLTGGRLGSKNLIAATRQGKRFKGQWASNKNILNHKDRPTQSLDL